MGRKRVVIHKHITVPAPTKLQKDAVCIKYYCVPTVTVVQWKKTDITNKKVNCKRCIHKMKKPVPKVIENKEPWLDRMQ